MEPHDLPAGLAADAWPGPPARRRTAIRLLPFLFLLLVVSYLDRTSLAYAALGMSRDLGFSDRVFSLGAGIFFLGYLALQIPGALLAERWSARKTISLSLAAWGSLTVLTAGVHTPMQLYAARFLLGLAEASLFPGVIVLLSHWFIGRDRAKAVSIFVAAAPFSLLVGSPVSGWILGRHWHGVEGWRWLFAVEGLPALVLAVVAFLYLTDWPQEAKWLPAEERAWIAAALEAERSEASPAVSMLQTMRSSRVMLLSAVGFFAYLSSYAAIFWMPTLLKRGSGLDDVHVGALLAIPFGVSLVAMLGNGWHSDRTLERRWHAAGPVYLLGLGALGLMVLPQSLPLTLVLFSLVCIEMAYLPVFWAIPSEMLSRSAAAAAVGVMSTIANIAGFCGPVLFGYLHTRTGSFASSYAMMLVAAWIAGSLMLLVKGGSQRAAMVSAAAPPGAVI